jgi:hypothetical protein
LRGPYIKENALAFAPTEFAAEDVEEAVGVEADEVDAAVGFAAEDAVIQEEFYGWPSTVR